MGLVGDCLDCSERRELLSRMRIGDLGFGGWDFFTSLKGQIMAKVILPFWV